MFIVRIHVAMREAGMCQESKYRNLVLSLIEAGTESEAALDFTATRTNVRHHCVLLVFTLCMFFFLGISIFSVLQNHRAL